MSPEELLAKVEALGVRALADGGALRLRPGSSVPPDLVPELLARKAELMEILRARGAAALKGSLPGGAAEAQPSLLAAEVVAMPLDKFARAGLVVEVRSKVLDEVVIFASDNAVVDPGEHRVVYRAAELQEILRLALGPKDLQSVHRVKRTFGGTIRPN